LKFTKIPCAVSRAQIRFQTALLERADARREHEVELARLGEIAELRLARMLAWARAALGLIELVAPIRRLQKRQSTSGSLNPVT
jgi:hypothetical protein